MEPPPATLALPLGAAAHTAPLLCMWAMSRMASKRTGTGTGVGWIASDNAKRASNSRREPFVDLRRAESCFFRSLFLVPSAALPFFASRMADGIAIRSLSRFSLRR